MPFNPVQADISRLFDRFVEDFASFQGSAVARHFVVPGVALRRDGTLRGFAALDEIAVYYQDALDRYRAAGCQSCRYENLEVDVLGETSAVAKVSWDLLAKDGSVVGHWRQAYFLLRQGADWRIFGSAFMTD